MNKKVYSAGNLVCIGGDEDHRFSNGRLKFPPMLGIVWYDEEFDILKFEQVSWNAAKILAPADLAALFELLMKARDEHRQPMKPDTTE